MKASVKYKVIYRHREKYSISEMCRFFEVSRSGYYDHVRRMDVPAKDLPLAEKIRECQSVCRNTYGYRRVHIWLERNGIHCNPKTVLRVMNKYNLLSVIRRKRYVKYGEHLHRYPNLLNRNFTAERPNQKWVKDIYKKYNYTCQLSGQKGGKLVVHHLNGYNWDIKHRLDINNGIVITKELHILFHKLYGQKDNTEEQFEEFKQRYHNGEFKEVT